MSKGIFPWNKWYVAAFVVLTILFGSATCGYCGKIKSFSAEQVSIDPSGKVSNVGKLYITPKKLRMDMKSPEGKGSIPSILRRDLKIYWMLNAKDKKYFERPLNEEDWKKAMHESMKQTEKDLGAETVNGFKCRKKEVETTIQFLGIKRKSRSIVWVSNKLAMPIRTESKDGYVTELRKIKAGRQPSSLFEVPSGYKKVANMMLLFSESSHEEAESTKEGSNVGKEKESFFKLPKNLSDKLPKEIKWPFGGNKEAGNK
jgi:outer membrane lipoprotein-sorting protein